VERMSPLAGLANNSKITFGIVSVFTILFVVSYLISINLSSKPDTAVKSVESFFAEFQMNFQDNNGSYANDVKYYSKGYQYDLMFMSNEVLLNLYSTDNSPPGSPNSTNSKTHLSQVSLEFLNAQKTPAIKGLAEFVPTKVAASLAASPANSTESYSEIKYSDIYPGIDVYFSGKQKQLFYEFVLSETADVSDVVLKVSGLEGVGNFDIDMHGNINVTCRGKQMQIKKPDIYRIVKQAKLPVSGYFIVTPQNEIRFKTVDEVKML